jgi:predicted AAA+ superfamily ATPase
MLAHNQGQILNAANLARDLAVDGKTIAGYLDLLVNLLVVRRLPAWHRNIGKRLVKSPKACVRYTGIAHALLGVRDKEASKHSSPRPRTGPKRTITQPPTGQRSTFSLRCLMANFGLLR